MIENIRICMGSVAKGFIRGFSTGVLPKEVMDNFTIEVIYDEPATKLKPAKYACIVSLGDIKVRMDKFEMDKPIQFWLWSVYGTHVPPWSEWLKVVPK